MAAEIRAKHPDAEIELVGGVRGDFIVTARGQFITPGGDPHKKFGWIARANLDANSPHVNAALHGNGDAYLLSRPTAGAQETGTILSFG